MNDIDRAKAMLQDMPDEAFDLWIRQCVAKSGWPYHQVADLGDQYWQGYFLDIPLVTIRSLQWDRRIISFDPSLFENVTSVMIQKMVLLHAHNFNPGVMVPADSKGRFDSAVSYIDEHGKIPGAIVLLSTPYGFKIFDGWHRLAAIHSLQESVDPIELPCWIAT